MSGKNTPQSVYETYRKRQQMMPFLFGGLAVILVAVGAILVIAWLTGPNKPGISLFATKTATATLTATPTPVTPTATATVTPTITETPTATLTPTASGPFEYTVQEGDTCWSISEQFDVLIDVLLALNPTVDCNLIKPNETVLLIPAPDTQLPTATPIPANFYGTINYTVVSGDTLASIASQFNSTVDAIVADNSDIITDGVTIYVGDVLKIRVNIVTPTSTRAPTSTIAVRGTQSTATLAPTVPVFTATLPKP
jgi:LysM repeat protein